MNLQVTFVNGHKYSLAVTEVEDCGETSVFRVESLPWSAYFEAERDANVTELGELAVAALYSELVTNVTEV